VLPKKSRGLSPTVPFSAERKSPVPASNAVLTITVILGARRMASPPDRVQRDPAT